MKMLDVYPDRQFINADGQRVSIYILERDSEFVLAISQVSRFEKRAGLNFQRLFGATPHACASLLRNWSE
jgi:hypothetical protein